MAYRDDYSGAEQLAATLRFLRADRGWTLREASEKTGVSNAYLNQLENCKHRNPTLGALRVPMRRLRPCHRETTR